MTPQPRLTGKPIMRILCKKTNILVGYLYQWNNGDQQPARLNNAKAEDSPRARRGRGAGGAGAAAGAAGSAGAGAGATGAACSVGAGAGAGLSEDESQALSSAMAHASHNPLLSMEGNSSGSRV